jgi:prophage endopeptidase
MTISPLRLVLFFLLVGLLGWVAYDQQRDQLVAARRERDDVQADLDLQIKAARLTGEQLATRDAIDRQRTEELNRARTENVDLQRAVAARDKRLLVKAVCPGSAAQPATGAAGLADAVTAELAADARPDYFTLRDELTLSREMILGLQDYIRQVVHRTPAQP